MRVFPSSYVRMVDESLGLQVGPVSLKFLLNTSEEPKTSKPASHS